MNTELTNKKFYTILLSEISQESVAVVPATPTDPKTAERRCSTRTLSEYAPQLYDELMVRRNFAVACLTPEKLVKASAKDIVYVVDKLGGMLRELSAMMPKDAKISEKITITDEERRRIEKFIGNLGK